MSTYYDELAKGYNELHGDEQRQKCRGIAQYVKTRVFDRILDVGCGTGLSRSFFKGEWVGVDSSRELLKQCPYPCRLAQAENLPFPDRSFDWVLCVTAIHNFSNVEKALGEMERVSNGGVVVTVLKKMKEEKKKRIQRFLDKIFEITRVVEEEKDDIFVLRSKNI